LDNAPHAGDCRGTLRRQAFRPRHGFEPLRFCSQTRDWLLSLSRHTPAPESATQTIGHLPKTQDLVHFYIDQIECMFYNTIEDVLEEKNNKVIKAS
jgi:hypothetical protein